MIKPRDRYVRTVVSVADMVMKSIHEIDREMPIHSLPHNILTLSFVESDGETMSLIIYCETGGPVSNTSSLILNNTLNIHF